MQIALTTRPDFSLAAVVESHGWIQLAPFHRSDQAPGFEYVARLATGPVVLLQVEEAPGGLLVSTSQALDKAGQAALVEDISWMLGLELDLSAFYAHVRDEPKLQHVAARRQGRLLRSPTLFEDTIKTILTTNTTWSGTIRMVKSLVELYGSPLPADPARRAFPRPAQLAAAGVETLRSGARLGYRAPYVLELARAVDGGALDLEALKSSTLPTPELRKELLAIKGVGDYAAANLLLLLGRYDYVPVDSWALRVVSNEWHAGRPIGRAEVQAAFAGWGEWKGLAYWFWNWSEATDPAA